MPYRTALPILLLLIPPGTARAEEAQVPAERVAAALADAATAAQAGKRGELQRALGVIEAAGAHPLDEAAADPVAAWRLRSAPAKVVLRGRALGPAYRSGHLAGNMRESLAQLFLSGRDASVALSAPEGGRLAITVRDKDARPVCRGETGAASTQPRNGCRWVPVYTQRYTIEVANLGGQDATYFLVID